MDMFNNRKVVVKMVLDQHSYNQVLVPVEDMYNLVVYNPVILVNK